MTIKPPSMIPQIPPPGTRYLADWYVSRDFEERTALGYLTFGDPVLLWGPRDQGCTWLCHHLARTWRDLAPARQTLCVDFRTLGAKSLRSLDTCLMAMATALEDALPEAPRSLSPSAGAACAATPRHGSLALSSVPCCPRCRASSCWSSTTPT